MRPPRPALLHPEVALALSPKRARALLVALRVPRALLALTPGSLEFARALFTQRVADAAAETCDHLAQIVSPLGREAALEAFHDLPELDAADLLDLSPADLGATLLTKQLRGDETFARVVHRVDVRLGRALPTVLGYALCLRHPRRVDAGALAKALATIPGLHVPPWVAVDDDGTLHAALLWSTAPRVFLEPTRTRVRPRERRVVHADILRYEVESGRITIVTRRPARIGVIADAIARSALRDARAFSQRPAFTLKKLLELQAGKKKLELPEGVASVEVVGCELLAADERRIEVRGPGALTEIQELAQRRGGYLASATLRFAVEGARGPVDVYIELPNQIGVRERHFLPEIQRALEALGVLSPGASDDDVVTLAKWVHPEWRWREVVGQEGFRRMVERGVLRADDPKKTRGVATEDMRAWGHTLRTFSLPHPLDEGKRYALADDRSVRARSVGEDERRMWRLDVARLCAVIRGELALVEANAVELPEGVVDLGEGAAGEAPVRTFYVMCAVLGEGEKKRMSRALASAARPLRAVVFVPRGRTLGGEIAEVEVDVAEQLGAASWEGKMALAGALALTGTHAPAEQLEATAPRERVEAAPAQKSSPRPTPQASPTEARIDIDGGFTNARFHVHVNGSLRELQRARFLFFLGLVAAHLRRPGLWSSRRELGIARNPEIPTRIREAFVTALPAGFNIVESDRNGRVRLNPGVMLGEIAWEVLGEHGLEEVRKIAAQVLARGGSGKATSGGVTEA